MGQKVSEKIDFAAKLASNSALVSRNVTINGRRTSVRLEPEMWTALRQIAEGEELTIHQLCTFLHERRSLGASFTATLRVFLMVYFRQQVAVPVDAGNDEMNETAAAA